MGKTIGQGWIITGNGMFRPNEPVYADDGKARLDAEMFDYYYAAKGVKHEVVKVRVEIVEGE